MIRPLAVPAAAFAAALALVVLSAGCGDSGDAVAPTFTPTVTSGIDSFHIVASSGIPVTSALQYTFVNTGPVARVEQTSTITAGSAFLVISDSTGIMLYSKDLAQTGAFDSFAGEPGTWRIQVSIENMQGSFEFRVRRKT